MKVLVTGSRGYIGRAVVAALEAAGHEARGFDLYLDFDVREPRDVLSMCGGMDAVIHLAAMCEVRGSIDNPLAYWSHNLSGICNLLAAMGDQGVKRLIFASSCAIYGQPEVSPIHEGNPAAPTNPYGRTKLAGEWAIADAARAHGLSTMALRLFNVAGATETNGEPTGSPRIIPRLLDAAETGKPLDIRGSWSITRDYVHLGDVARAFVLALEKVEPGFTAVNIGRGAGTSIGTLRMLAEEITGRQIQANVVHGVPGEPRKLVAGIERAKEVLDWEPTIDARGIIESSWWHRQGQRVAPDRRPSASVAT